MSADFTIEGMKKYNESIGKVFLVVGLIGEKSEDFFIIEFQRGIFLNFLKFLRIIAE